MILTIFNVLNVFIIKETMTNVTQSCILRHFASFYSFAFVGLPFHHALIIDGQCSIILSYLHVFVYYEICHT